MNDLVKPKQYHEVINQFIDELPLNAEFEPKRKPKKKISHEVVCTEIGFQEGNMSNKVLGECIRNMICNFSIKSMFGYQMQNEAVKELDELIEKANRVDELEKELEADHASSEEIIEDLTIDYNQMCEENEELKQDALLGKAILLLANTDREHDLLRYIEFDAIYQTFRLPDGDGAYDIKILDWYSEKMKEVSND